MPDATSIYERVFGHTNIPSELTRTRPDARVETFLRGAGKAVHLSVLSVGEIRKGVELLPDSSRRLLERWLDNEIRLWFGDRILPVTIAVAERWGAIAATAKRAGRQLPVIDGLIAATAIEHELVLVTRNLKDFDIPGIQALNPWAAPA